MRKAFIALFLSLTVLVSPLVGASEAAAPAKTPEEGSIAWQAQPGDYLVVDLTKNMGYLIRQDDSNYYAFEVISGQQRRVWHIGLSYYAATPERQWEARQLNIQPDRTTYGENGHFLRLFYKDQRTHYGIHGHRYSKSMFKEADRYQSMGCVIVRDEILELIEKTFEMNQDKLKVITTKNIDQFEFLK